MRIQTTLVALATAGAVLAAPARAQDAGEILDRALDAYVERAEGVQNYAITYSGFMGQGSFTSYFEKEMVDGFPVFRQVSVEGLPSGSTADTDDWDPYRQFPEIAERAEHAGTETVDGVEAHVLEVDDFEGLDFAPPSASGGEFTPESMRLWIDEGDWLIRRMRIDGSMTVEGEARPIAMLASLRDYRTVEGMPFPYETSIAVEGAMAASGMSEEEAEEARARLEEMRAQLEALPEERREMMERLMGPQIEQLEQMVGSGNFEMTLTVEDVRVNEGPPTS